MRARLVILLLSGGKDSSLSLERLLETGYKVVAVCIGGKEGREVAGAKKAAERYNIELHIVQLDWLNEQTYSPIQLICRNLVMLFKSIQLALRYKARFIAAGTKKVDSKDKRLFWIPLFMFFCVLVISCLGIKPMFPVWNEK